MDSASGTSPRRRASSRQRRRRTKVRSRKPALGDALDDVGRFRGIGWSPVVGDGFGDATEFDDGEFASEPALEGVDAAAELGDGHGIASRRGNLYLDKPDQTRLGNG